MFGANMTALSTPDRNIATGSHPNGITPYKAYTTPNNRLPTPIGNALPQRSESRPTG